MKYLGAITSDYDLVNKKYVDDSIPTVPTITLNGTQTTSPSFYAPTSVGTSGYVLKSNGSGAPTWTSATLTDTKVTEAYSTANNSYPLLMTATAGISSTSSRGATTSILNNQLYANPSTGTLSATYFNGAAAATTAYTTANMKNIIESTADPGTTTAPNGTVWLKYGDSTLPTMADYVVEQHVSASPEDSWSWTKWNSGKAECWMEKKYSTTVTTAWGSVYYTTLAAVSFPFTFVTSASSAKFPMVLLSSKSTSGRCWFIQNTGTSLTSTGSIYAISPQAYTSAFSMVVGIYAVGLWK